MPWSSSANALIAQLDSPNLSHGFFEFEAEVRLSPASVHLFDGSGAGFNALKAAVDAHQGIGNAITTLLRATDNSSDRRGKAAAVGHALGLRLGLGGGPGAQVQVIAANPSPGALQAQYHALTVLLANR
jgi:hypothetical protein